MSLKLAVLIVLISVFIGAQAQTDSTPDTIIERFAARFKIDIDAKLKAFLDDQAEKLVNLLKAITDLDSLKPDPKWTQAVVNLAQASVQKVLQGVPIIESKVKLLSDVVRNVGDVKSAVLLECEDVRSDLTAVILAGKANLQSKAKTFVDMRAAINEVTPLNFLIKLLPLRTTLANLRSKIDLSGFLAEKIDALESELNATVPTCEEIAEKAAAVAALNIVPKYQELKAALVQKVSTKLDKAETRIKELITNILDAKLKSLAGITYVLDEANKQVKLTIGGVYAKGTETLEEVKAALERVVKTAVKAVLLNVNIKINVFVNPPAKRQAALDVSFTITVTAGTSALEIVANLKAIVPRLPIATAVATYAKEFGANLKTAATEIEAIKAQLVQTTVQKLQDGIKVISQELSEIKLEEAKQALETQLLALKTKIAKAKTIVDAAVDATVDNVKEILAVKSAQIEAQISELKANIEEFKSKLPSAKVVVETIKQSIVTANNELKEAAESLKPVVQAKIDALYDQLKKAMAEAATVAGNLAKLKKALVDAIVDFEKQKIEIAAQLAKTAAGKFAATAEQIQTLVVAKEAEVTAQLKDLATLVNAAIANLQAKWEKLPSGFKGSIEITFDASLLTEAKVKAYLAVILQAKFGAKLDITPVKTTKRALTTTSFDATVSSTDGSTANVVAAPSDAAAAPQTSSSSLPLGAIIGIVVGAVVLVAIVVAVVLVKKGQNSKMGRLL